MNGTTNIQLAEESLDLHALVEIMGHTRLAGRVRTVSIGGAPMLRVDVPELPEVREGSLRQYDASGRYLSKRIEVEEIKPAEPAHARYFGMSAVFSITPVSAEEALKLAEKQRRLSVRHVYPPQPMIESAAQPKETASSDTNPGDDSDDDMCKDDFEDDDSGPF